MIREKEEKKKGTQKVREIEGLSEVSGQLREAGLRLVVVLGFWDLGWYKIRMAGTFQALAQAQA